MSKTKIFIYSKSKNLAEGLTRSVSKEKIPDVEVKLLTEQTKKEQFENRDYAVSDDAQWLGGLSCHTIQLVRKPEAEQENTIFMYQSRAQLCKKLLERIHFEGRMTAAAMAVKVICVFSPEGGDEKTVLAFQKAIRCTDAERVLYISLCGFPVLFGDEICEKPDTHNAGISELMMCSESGEFDKQLAKLAITIGKIHIIAPVESYKDLLDYTKKDISKLMYNLKEQTQYDVVIIECAQLFEHVFELFKKADEIHVPFEQGFFAAVKRHVLHDYCVSEVGEEIWEKIQFDKVTKGVPTDGAELRRLFNCEGRASVNG